MVKSTARKTRKPTRQISVADRPWFRPLLIAVVAGVIGGFMYISAHKSGSTSDARQVADAFAAAYQDCDAQTVKKYYLPFQTDSTKLSDYEKSCVKGQSHLSYSKQLSGSEQKNASFLYDYSDGAKHGQLMLYLIYNPDTKAWQVFSATPTSFQQ